MKDLCVMYHYVMNRNDFKGSVPIEPVDFRTQIKFAKKKYNVVTPSSILNNGKSNFLITFDDATKDQYINAYKILKEEKVPAFFSIMSGPLEEKKVPIFHLVHIILSNIKDEILWNELKNKFNISKNIDEMSAIYSYEKNIYRRYNKYVLNFFLDEEISREFLEGKIQQIYGSLSTFIEQFYISPKEIIEMYKNGMEIGVHCVHHRPYSGNAQSFYDNEIKPCKEYLANLIGEDPKWYVPAFGGGENTQEMLNELTPILIQNGFKGGFTTIEGYCNFSNNDFWHNRVDCNKLEQFLEKEGIIFET